LGDNIGSALRLAEYGSLTPQLEKIASQMAQ
jgi:hypothetical protein